MIRVIYTITLILTTFNANAGLTDYFTASGKLNTISPELNLASEDNSFSMSLDNSPDVTLAEFSSSMNCKTGDINITASIPEITNFNEAIKAFAPYAVNDEGQVDFGNFIQDLLTEFAYQEVSEISLDFIAYIHYYITGTMNNETKPGDLDLFRSDQFRSCKDDVTASVVKEGQGGGGTTGADQDTMHFLLGLDAGAFLGYAKCYKNNRIVVGPDEAERFEKSKKIVRAIFNKFLNSEFNFNVQMPQACTEFEKATSKPPAPGQEEQQNLWNLSKIGEIRWMDNSTNTIGNYHTEKQVLKPSSGETGNIGPSTDLPNKTTGPSTELSSTNDTTGVSPTGEIMNTGSTTQSIHDWSTLVSFIPSPNNVIDFIDLKPLERIYFYDQTLKDFFENIKESKGYRPLTANSKSIASDIIKRLVSLQQFNPVHLEYLECAINHETCNYNWITHAHYSLFVDNNGKKYTCSNYGSTPDSPCLNPIANPHTFLNGPKNQLPVNKYLQSQYMRKKIQNLFTEYVTDYYLSSGAFVFEETFKDYPKVETVIRNKIRLLHKSDLIYKYWTSPIANISDYHLSLINNSRSLKDPSAGNLYQTIKKIIYDIVNQTNVLVTGTNTQTTNLSLTPFLYQPINELQLAKTLYMMEDTINIKQMSTISANTSIPSISVNPLRINPHDWRQLDNSVVNSKNDVVEPRLADNPISLSSSWNCMMNCPTINLPTKDTPQGVVYGSANLPLPNMSALLQTELSQMKSPFTTKEHRLSTNDALALKFFPYNNSTTTIPYIDRSTANNVLIILTAFRKFYVKRLLDKYTEKYRMVPDFVYKQIKTRNATVTSLDATEYDLKRTDFKMEMRRQMLRLLTY